MSRKCKRDTPSIAAQLISGGVVAPDDAASLAESIAAVVNSDCHVLEISSPAQLAVAPGIVVARGGGTHVHLLIGWLRSSTIERSIIDDVEYASTPPADVGTLLLEAGGERLPCSMCADAVPSPDLLDSLVLITSWAYVPRGSARASRAYVEVDARPCALLRRTAAPAPPLRSHSVSEAWRALSQLGAPARLWALRGELTTLSEPFGTREPIFFAELRSADANETVVPPATEAEAPHAVVAFVGHEAARWRGVLQPGRVYVLTNLRQGWLGEGPDARPVLRSSTDDCTHPEKRTSVYLVEPDEPPMATAQQQQQQQPPPTPPPTPPQPQQPQQEQQQEQPCRAKRPRITRGGGGGGGGGGGDEYPPQASQRIHGDGSSSQLPYVHASQLPCFNGESLRSQSELWESSAAPVQGAQLGSQARAVMGTHARAAVGTQARAEEGGEGGGGGGAGASVPTTARPSLINYEGFVTGRRGSYALELDHQYLLLLSHVAKQSRHGVRVGAHVLALSVHTLLLPAAAAAAASDDDDDDVDGAVKGEAWPVVGFGLCARGSLHILKHAPLPGEVPNTAFVGAPDEIGAPDEEIQPPSTPPRWLTRLATQLNLAELATCFVTLLEPHRQGGQAGGALRTALARRPVGWAARWSAVLSTDEAEEALSRLLSAHGLSTLRPEVGGRWQRYRGPPGALPAQGTELRAPRLAALLAAGTQMSFTRAELRRLGVSGVHATSFVVARPPATTPSTVAGESRTTAAGAVLNTTAAGTDAAATRAADAVAVAPAAPHTAPVHTAHVHTGAAASSPSPAMVFVPAPCWAAHRDAYAEFDCHAIGCHLAEARAPLPAPPTIAEAARRLRALPAVRAAMANVCSTGRSQLVLDSHLGPRRPWLVGQVTPTPDPTPTPNLSPNPPSDPSPTWAGGDRRGMHALARHARGAVLGAARCDGAAELAAATNRPHERPARRVGDLALSRAPRADGPRRRDRRPGRRATRRPDAVRVVTRLLSPPACKCSPPRPHTSPQARVVSAALAEAVVATRAPPLGARAARRRDEAQSRRDRELERRLERAAGARDAPAPQSRSSRSGRGCERRTERPRQIARAHDPTRGGRDRTRLHGSRRRRSHAWRGTARGQTHVHSHFA